MIILEIWIILTENSPKFDKVGTYTFDGNQAVAYSRIRYMEGGGHARANHQRLVLEGIMNAAKKQPFKLGKLIGTVLPQCKTSLSDNDLTKLTFSMARSSITDSQAYPFQSEDERYGGIYYGFLSLPSRMRSRHTNTSLVQRIMNQPMSYRKSVQK